MTYPRFVFYGHHRCATTWMHAILREVAAEAGRRFAIIHNPKLINRDLGRYAEEERIDILSFSNADWRFAQSLKVAKGFHVVRDPRDIVVSSYFSHLHSHSTQDWPELIEHRQKLKSVSKEEGLRHEIDFRAQQFEEMMTWEYDNENILEMRMEDLVRHPYTLLLDVFSFVDFLAPDSPRYIGEIGSTIQFFINKINAKFSPIMPIKIPRESFPAFRLLALVYRHRFDRISGGRKIGSEDVKSHYRKGVAGDWVNHLSPENLDYFKKQYNELLLKLGYEDDPDWSV